MNEAIAIGRMLRAGASGFVAGCRVGASTVPAFGTLVRAQLEPGFHVYGLIHDIRIEDDGLVRQLVAAEGVSDEVFRDNRERRIVPVEMSVVVVGWEQAGIIHHQLPPRPPLSLDQVFPCEPEELRRFTSTGKFGYFRHLLRMPELPLGELLSAHVQQARAAHADPQAWTAAALQEIIVLLRDDYHLLTSVLGALENLTDAEALDKTDRK